MMCSSFHPWTQTAACFNRGCHPLRQISFPRAKALLAFGDLHRVLLQCSTAIAPNGDGGAYGVPSHPFHWYSQESLFLAGPLNQEWTPVIDLPSDLLVPSAEGRPYDATKHARMTFEFGPGM